jgi:hypothetical protein
MRRLLAACGASLVLYIAAFAFLLDRPLTLGTLRARIEASLATGEISINRNWSSWPDPMVHIRIAVKPSRLSSAAHA